MAVDAKTNEITVIHILLAGLLLEGWDVTMNALLTQQKIAHAIVTAGGDDPMLVKENQPTSQADIATASADPRFPAWPGGMARPDPHHCPGGLPHLALAVAYSPLG